MPRRFGYIYEVRTVEQVERRYVLVAANDVEAEERVMEWLPGDRTITMTEGNCDIDEVLEVVKMENDQVPIPPKSARKVK